MEFVTKENICNFAYTNEHLIRNDIIGIAIEFSGLNGGTRMITEDSEMSSLLAYEGILYIIPYLNPWNWMNDASIKLTDAIISAIIEKYSLSSNIPIAVFGGSMGGQCALVYTVYAKHTPIACAANCPVCDMLYHFTERLDLPRTIWSAFGESPLGIESAVKKASPIHIADKMPNIKYYLTHGTADKSVSKTMHTDRLYELMKGKDVTYVEQIGMDHGQMDDFNIRRYQSFVIDAIKAGR